MIGFKYKKAKNMAKINISNMTVIDIQSGLSDYRISENYISLIDFFESLWYNIKKIFLRR